MYKLGKRVVVSEPDDNTLSSNGGDYYYYEQDITDEKGDIILTLHSTSAEFDFCEVSGRFGQTITVYITDVEWEEDEPLPVEVQRYYYGLEEGDQMTLRELINKVYA